MSAPVTVQERSAKPWKYKGYPGFAKWMASSHDFIVFRRFGELNVRTMLLMQDRIARKEEELFRIDKLAQDGPDELGDSSSLRHDPQRRREKILDELTPMLKQYSKSSHDFDTRLADQIFKMNIWSPTLKYEARALLKDTRSRM